MTDANGNLVLSTSKAEQLPLWVRAVYFVFAGWYLGLAATMLAWILSLGIVTIPLSVMLIDRLPAIITLQKN